MRRNMSPIMKFQFFFNFYYFYYCCCWGLNSHHNKKNESIITNIWGSYRVKCRKIKFQLRVFVLIFFKKNTHTYIFVFYFHINIINKAIVHFVFCCCLFLYVYFGCDNLEVNLDIFITPTTTKHKIEKMFVFNSCSDDDEFLIRSSCSRKYLKCLLPGPFFLTCWFSLETTNSK